MAIEIYTPPTFQKIAFEIPDDLLQFVDRYVAFVNDVHGLDASVDRVLEMMCESVIDSSRKTMRAFRAQESKPEQKDDEPKNKKLPKPDDKTRTPSIGPKQDTAAGAIRGSG